MIYTIANPKGGTGKTESARRLARYWSDSGRRLLVVGLDPVGTISRLLGADASAPTMADVLRNAARLDQAARPSILPGVDIAKESSGLERIDGELTAAQFGSFRLLSALRSLDGAGAYDDVLIDSPGAMGAITRSAILAADRVIVASAPAENSIDGLESFLCHYSRIYADPGIAVIRPQLPAALIVGQIVTQYRETIRSHRVALAGLAELLPILGTVPLHAGRDADKRIHAAYGPIFFSLIEGAGGYPVDWSAAAPASGVTCG